MPQLSLNPSPCLCVLQISVYLLALLKDCYNTHDSWLWEVTPTFVYMKTTHKNETITSPSSIKNTSSVNYAYVSVYITWAFPVGKVHLFIEERTHRSQINRSECLKIEVTSSYHVSAFSHIHSGPLVQLGSVLKCGFIVTLPFHHRGEYTLKLKDINTLKTEPAYNQTSVVFKQLPEALSDTSVHKHCLKLANFQKMVADGNIIGKTAF